MNWKNSLGPAVTKHPGDLTEPIKKNYFFSGWIGNFGVEPLLLFSAFLLLPAFDFLRALLFFVTRVFETISLLLQLKQLSELSRIKYLPRTTNSVKVLALGLALSFGIPLQASQNQSLIMSIGEVKELQLPGIHKFTMGDNDSVSHRFSPKKGRLLLKAKKLGLSELHLWLKDGGKKVFKIYVLSRTDRLKLMSLSESLQSLGLETKVKGPYIEVKGIINKATLFSKFHQIYRGNRSKIESQLEVSKPLRKNLLTEVISTLFEDQISEFKCRFELIELICKINNKRSPSPEIEKYLKEKYSVKFLREIDKHDSTNFRVKIKIIQFESSSGEFHNFGLDQISGTVGEVFEKGWKSLIDKNKLLLKDKNLSADILAEPTSLVRAGREMSVQVGAEVPYSNTNKFGSQQTSFKFAGLKLKLLLHKEGDGFLIDYSTEITKPGINGVISGSKESASARIRPGRPLELFELYFQTNAIDRGTLPVLSRVPLLGKIFTSSDKKKSFKKITGLILLEEH